MGAKERGGNASKMTIIILTIRRLWAQRGLTLATLTGLTVALTLIMTVPLYADAVNFRILQEQLSSQTERNNRPPFAYLYNYIGAWHDPVEWEAVQPVTDYLQREGAQVLGLPPQQFVWHVETDDYRLMAGADNVAQMRFGTTGELQDQIEIVVGSWPTQAAPQPDAPIGVLMTLAQAQEIGAAVGDRFMMVNPRNRDEQLPIMVMGLWQPLDPNAAYWFYAPTTFDQIVVVPNATYAGRIAETLSDEVHLAAWYWVLDGARVGTGDVARLVDGARMVEAKIDDLLPNSQALQSPIESLENYERAVSTLTGQLLGFNAPTIGLVVAFIGLVVGLAVQQRRNELAITRSRGGTAGQLIGMAALEGVILGVIGFVLGTLLAMWLTGQMGRVRSFLDFSAETQLRTLPNRTTLIAGVVALLCAVVAQIIPTAAAAGDTIITYKQEQARRRRPPWWQRTWLDLILFGLAAYGFYQLQTGQTLFATGSSVLESPILLLLPTMGILSVTLFFLRLLPLVMRLLSRLLALTNSITLLQATRYLARSTGLYATPLVLLTLTVSLSVFTASLARTFDLQLYDQAFYRIGADMNVLTSPDTSAQNRFLPQPIDMSNDLFVPPAAYEAITGVDRATRVGQFPSNILLDDELLTVTFIGVERDSFGEVAYWREDFSPYRLGSLMNGLGRSAESIIVPTVFLTAHGLAVGDVVPLAVSVAGGRVEISAEIVANFDYFPTWYPTEDDLIMVGNLSTIFEQIGGEVAYRVWLDVNEEFDSAEFDRALQSSGITIWREPRTTIEQTLVLPQRQGVFGLLSVGFIASALLTVLGFFLYAVFSFRRRMIELGILRAIGLSVGRMMGFIAWELGLLIVAGLGLGTVLGVWMSQQFIPFLQTGTRIADFVPPYLVEIAWPAISQIYVLFGLLFLAAFVVLSLLLRRMKVFEAVKLGETV
jgi:putative ABC transport system permease protein